MKDRLEEKRLYRLKNRDAILLGQKKYRRENREKLIAYAIEYRRTHKTECLLRAQSWRKRNRERADNNRKSWRAKNRDKGRAYSIKYQKKYYKIKNYSQKAREYLNKYPWRKVLMYIRQRCNYKKHEHYEYYGGRGIECKLIAAELKILWFRDKAHLMKKPSIDRIDNDGHYEFKNCQFIEHSENIKKQWADRRAE